MPLTASHHTSASEVFARRKDKLAEQLAKARLGAYFFGGVTDLHYLTGFRSEGFSGLVGPSETWLFASPLIAGQIKENTRRCRVVTGRFTPVLKKIMASRRFKSVGFDPEQTTFHLGRLLMKLGLAPRANPLSAVRVVKDEKEIEFIRRACRITADAAQHMRGRLRRGRTERQFAQDVLRYFERRGAQGAAFDLIAATGPHTALPHHQSGERPLGKNEPVLFDIGCTVEGYRSDLTRTFYYGKIPDDFRRVYGVVDQAQKAGLAQVRAGVLTSRVDRATRREISQRHYGRFFIHSTGHGVGLDIHEAPWVRSKSKDVLQNNMVLTVEPGVYLPGRFGVRLEDTVRVTENGFEILTKTRERP